MTVPITCALYSTVPEINQKHVDGNFYFKMLATLLGEGNPQKLLVTINNRGADDILLNVEFPAPTPIIENKKVPKHMAHTQTYTPKDDIVEQEMVFRVTQIDGGEINFGISVICAD